MELIFLRNDDFPTFLTLIFFPQASKTNLRWIIEHFVMPFFKVFRKASNILIIISGVIAESWLDSVQIVARWPANIEKESWATNTCVAIWINYCIAAESGKCIQIFSQVYKCHWHFYCPTGWQIHSEIPYVSVHGQQWCWQKYWRSFQSGVENQSQFGAESCNRQEHIFADQHQFIANDGANCTKQFRM